MCEGLGWSLGTIKQQETIPKEEEESKVDLGGPGQVWARLLKAALVKGASLLKVSRRPGPVVELTLTHLALFSRELLAS